jgi:hypothetical protein
MSSTPSKAPAPSSAQVAAAHRGEQIVHVPGVGRRHRDDLLGDDVERVPRVARGLDGSLVHRLGYGRAGDQIAAELREDDALAHCVRLMAAAPDSLEAAGDRWRRLDLHDQVDGAHVDTELERRSGHQRTKGAGFQQIFDLARCSRAIEP